MTDEYVGKMQFFNEPMYLEWGMSEKEFMSIQHEIHAMDPEEKYFIAVREIVHRKRTDPLLADCIALERPRAAVPSIYAIWVQRKIETSPPVNEWTKEQRQHALDGMLLLHSRGIVHNDISVKNFGFRRGLPVYIDMDSASRALPVHIRHLRSGRYGIDLNQTREFDVNQFTKCFS